MVRLLLAFQLFSVLAFGGVRFDGTDDFAHRGHSPEYLWTNEMTMSLWFLRETGGTGTYMELVSKAIIVSGDKANFGSRINRLTDRFDYYWTYSPGNYAVASQGLGITESDFKWHHAAFRVRWGVTNTYNCYIDGVLSAIAAIEGTLATVSMTNVDPVRVGFNYANSQWKGQIDEVAIWNAYLSDAELQSLYFGKVKRLPLQFRPDKLISYWAFDEVPSWQAASGTNMFRDLSGKNIDLTPVNSPVARPNELFSYP